MLLYTDVYHSPVGALHIAVNKDAQVCYIKYADLHTVYPHLASTHNHNACAAVIRELTEYFQGRRQNFSVKTHLAGTDFQHTVWKTLCSISYGETTSYSALAQKIGRQNAARAVGNAVATNPISIIVPCHRVLPASGTIGKYGLRTIPQKQGARIKQYLLAQEANTRKQTTST